MNHGLNIRVMFHIIMLVNRIVIVSIVMLNFGMMNGIINMGVRKMYLVLNAATMVKEMSQFPNHHHHILIICSMTMKVLKRSFFVKTFVHSTVCFRGHRLKVNLNRRNIMAKLLLLQS